MIAIPNSNYSMWVKNSIGALLVFFGVLSCTQEKQNDFDTRMQKLGVNIATDTRAVFEIGDKGCPNCNQSMINAFCHFKNRNDVFFLIAANPNRLDISCFLEEEPCNTVFCKKDDFEKSEFEFNTKVYFLKNGIRDTTIYFDVNGWESGTKYLTEELKKQ